MTALRLRLKAVKHARIHVGNMELGGNNRGYWVERIIKYAQGTVPEAWCVDFVIWCYGHAGSTRVKPGFTRAVRYMFPAPHSDLIQVSQPHLGNIVRYTFDHTGLFLNGCNAYGSRRLWRFATHIKTIEGNTGATGAESDSSTGGDGVYVKIRSRALVRDYLRVLR